MAPNYCSRIVRTQPGSGTAETLYLTNDGKWWTDAPRGDFASSTTGVERGYLHGDYICPHAEPRDE